MGNFSLVIILLFWFISGSFLGDDFAGYFIFSRGIRNSRVTLAPVADNRETAVGILDSKNIYVHADGSNWITQFDVLFTLYVLIDSLFILSFLEIGATKISFDSSILSLGDFEFLLSSSSSKSFLYYTL